MMIRACRENTESVLAKVRSGRLDMAALGMSNLVDEIILAMHTNGILTHISESIQDVRADNTTIPYNLVWASAIAAKMKVRTSLTDIPFAISDSRTLAELGYTLISTDGKLGAGLMRESSIRALLGKYQSNSLFNGYNEFVQNHIFPELDISPNIHILDCTDLEVNFHNRNYEGSGICQSKHTALTRDHKEINTYARGYKLSTLRGIVGDTGLIEDIRFGPMNTHDLTLSLDMLQNSPVLKSGDILINDRGFISYKEMNNLKRKRGVDTYVPLRSNMDGFKFAVQIATEENNWTEHPNKKRTSQKIAFVPHIEYAWESVVSANEVPLNACVVWDVKTDNYAVFVTTDTTKSAKDIIRMYELRPEIEEDYRQLKDFWKLEDFKSTQLNMIAFHIVSVLLGYLFFQIYTMLPDGEKLAGKSLPVVLKSYEAKPQSYVILYVDYEFGIVTFIDMMKLYAACGKIVKNKIESVMGQI